MGAGPSPGRVRASTSTLYPSTISYAAVWLHKERIKAEASQVLRVQWTSPQASQQPAGYRAKPAPAQAQAVPKQRTPAQLARNERSRERLFSLGTSRSTSSPRALDVLVTRNHDLTLASAQQRQARPTGAPCQRWGPLPLCGAYPFVGYCGSFLNKLLSPKTDPVRKPP